MSKKAINIQKFNRVRSMSGIPTTTLHEKVKVDKGTRVSRMVWVFIYRDHIYTRQIRYDKSNGRLEHFRQSLLKLI